MNTAGLIYCVVIITIQGLVKSHFLTNLEDPDVRAVKTRLEEEKAKRLLLQNDVEVLMTKVEMLERNMKEDVTQHSAPDSRKPEISFSARLQPATSLSSTQVIVFNQALHNEGTAYSPQTGIFRAPFSGRYVFSLTLMSPSVKAQQVHAQIMRNADEIGRLFTGDNKADWGHNGSMTVVTSLAVGDEVFVREMVGLSGHIHGDFYCAFSGFRL